MKITFKDVVFTLIFGAIIFGFGIWQGHKQCVEKFEQIEKEKMDIDTAKMMQSFPAPKITKLNLFYFPEKEKVVIADAALRNNLKSFLYPILYAIRKAENGAKRREMGIIHSRCKVEMDKRPNETLDIQAGWCAATIQKNYDRWVKSGSKNNFISFLGEKYCPTKGGLSVKESELNKYWITNVKFWSKKINGDKENREWRRKNV